MTLPYALIDADLLLRYAIDLQRAAKYLKLWEIPIAQYRDKRGSDAQVADALKTLRELYQGTLIVNDRLTLVDLADGVHLGQEDLAAVDPDPLRAVEKIRREIGPALLGLSTHNEEEIALANTLDLDYIGLGAYRSTQTKNNAKVGGKALLKIARISRHPVAIIGGVRWEDEFENPVRWKVLGSAFFERMRHSCDAI